MHTPNFVLLPWLLAKVFKQFSAKPKKKKKSNKADILESLYLPYVDFPP